MALGVIRVRGNLCKYGPKAPNKAKRGKFTTCSGKKITGGAGHKRKAHKGGCKKQVVNQFGNKRCAIVCRDKKGKITSTRAASGCKGRSVF